MFAGLAARQLKLPCVSTIHVMQWPDSARERLKLRLQAYARKLADAGVEVELRRFPDQIHGFLNVVGTGCSARAACAEVAARLAVGLRPRQ